MIRLGLISPRFLDDGMRGGENTIKIFFENAPKNYDITMLSSNTVDIKSQHWIVGKKIHPDIIKLSDTKKIYHLKTKPTASVICNLFHFPISIALRSWGLKPYSYVPLDKARIIGWGPYTPKIMDVIEKEKFDVIHGSTFPTTTSYLGYLASKKLDVPFVYSPYYHFRIKRYRESIVLKKIVTNSSLILANTEIERMELIKIGGNAEKIVVVPPPYRVEPSLSHLTRKENAKKIFELDDYFVVLAHPWIGKGILMILESLRSLSNDKRKLALLTIGTPNRQYTLTKKKFEKYFKIKDLGWVNESLKWKAFSSCDVFILPSLNDSFGLSILDAWSAGKPVIGLRNTSSENIIKEGKNGFLVDHGKTLDLAIAINNLIEDEELATRFGINGKEEVMNKYRPDRISTLFFDAISSVI